MSGRPSSFTQETADAICERLIEGESLRAICADGDMPSMMTVLRWLDANDQFRGQYARSRELQGDTMDAMILDTAIACNGDNHLASRVKIDAFKWRAAKLKPKVYGDKVTAELTGLDGKALTDETALAARVASLLTTAQERRDREG